MTKRSLSYVLIALLVVLVSTAITSETASAQSNERTSVELAMPAAVTVGDEIELRATVSVGGAGATGVTVKFLRFAKFMNAGNDVLIGTATTDSNGVAVVDFLPRSEGEILITAEVEATDDVRSAITDGVVEVGAGPALFTQEAGISVPGITVAWLAVILGAIWMTFMYVLVLVWRIAKQGALLEVAEGESGE